MTKRHSFDDLPVPVLIVSKRNGRMLYVNAHAHECGIVRGESLFHLLEDEAVFWPLLNGERTQCRVTLNTSKDVFSADITAADTVFEGEDCLLVLMTRMEPFREQSESSVMMAICDIMTRREKQPVYAFLRMTAQYSGAFYAAMYEKSNGRYLIKREWRQRKGVCVPVLRGDFHVQPGQQMAKLKALKRAADGVYLSYTKPCGTQGAVLYFFDRTADAALRSSLEKYVSLFKALLPGEPPKIQTSLIKKGLDALAQGLALWDGESLQLLYHNKGYKELFGTSGAPMISKQLREDLQAGGRRMSEYTDITGNSYAIAHSSVQTGQKTLITTLIWDVTKYRQAEKRLEQMAKTDVLTGLLNRRAGLETLQRVYKQCKAQIMPLTVCFADIDGLKYINDTCGHDAGDRMIRLAADVLSNHVEKKGCVCRLGGDEFVLILPGLGVVQARMLAARIEKAVAKNQTNEGIAISFGFAQAAYSPEENVDTLIGGADLDMYREKRKRMRL